MTPHLTLSDRLLRSLFVALAVGMAWGIRGAFGHAVGAMYPGAALGLAFAFVTGQRSMWKWMPILGLLGALGISIGGMMSYGVLHGYAKSDTMLNYSYGFFALLLQGGAWGGFGCGLIAFALEKRPPRVGEWASAITTALAAGWATYQVVVVLLGFHINPPRSDLSIGFTGAILGLLVWLWANDKVYGFKGAFFGYWGFGLGMAIGRLLANASCHLPFEVSHWKVMEISCGLIGGFVFAFTMLGKKFEDPPKDDWHPILSHLGVLYVMAGIPMLHRLYRLDLEQKTIKWTEAALRIGVEDTAMFVNGIIEGIQFVCLLGFVGAALWYFLLLRQPDRRPSAFPVLFLSLVMVLFQNLATLYFWSDPKENEVNLHTSFWVFLSLMTGYSVFVPRPPVTDPDEVVERVDLRNALSWAFVVFCLVLIVAGFVNGEETMKSANTRFPLWSWREGPFPRE